jgi:hypothetical protein
MVWDIQQHTKKLLHIREYSSTSDSYALDTASSFAINYLFLSDPGQQQSQVELAMEPFDARTEQNDYEVCHVPVTSVLAMNILPRFLGHSVI